MDGISWLGLAAGVMLAWLLNLHVRDNPAAIPIRRVVIRALPGIALFVLLGMVFSATVFISSVAHIPDVHGNSTLRFLLALVTGFSIPQTARIKDHLLTRKIARKYPVLTSCIQWVDESSRLYCSKIISREERKLSFELLCQDHDARQCAIHRLFEFHLIEIAHSECERLKKEHEPTDPVLNIFNVRNAQVKLKYYARFVGYRVAVEQIRFVASNPLMIFDTWPPSPEDRRQNRPNTGHGRRKYEQPYVKAYVLGHF
jgi:hypothetical protein